MGLLLSGCDSTADLSCMGDKDCLESEVCHPDQLICVQVCTIPKSCPDTYNCAPISESNPTKVCTCKTDKCKPPGKRT